MPWLDELREAVDPIREAPLHAMSLGSKELFHSNLLGWLAENVGPGTLFGSWMVHDHSAAARRPLVRREHLHLDLVLEDRGYRPLVIENKSFALPDRAQLDRYGKNVLQLAGSGTQATAVLLSLVRPSWPVAHITQIEEGTVTWHHKTYRELGELVTSCESAVSGYAGATVREYAHYVVNLQKLCDVVGEQGQDDPVDLPTDATKILDRARFGALAQKVGASDVAASARHALKARGIPDSVFEVNSGFTRGRAMLELFESVQRDGVRRGIQYQNGQIRLAAIMGRLKGRSPSERARREQRAQAMVDTGEWFDFNDVDSILGSRTRSQPRPDRWLRYDPDFVYRYRSCPDVTPAELVAITTSCAERLLETGSL